MGYWKGFRSRRTRRGFRSKRKRIVRKARIPPVLQPITKLIRANVVEYVNHTWSGTGAIQRTSLQLNSIDDTFGGASTQRILGYDQWKTLYKKAMVLASKVVCQVHNDSSSSVMIGLTPMPLSNANTTLTNYEHYIETPRTRSKLLSPDVDRAILTAQASVKKLLSISNYKDNKERLEINLLDDSSTPTDGLYWHLWSQPQSQSNPTTLGNGVQFTIKVQYIIMLYDPIIPSRSVDT